MAEILQFERPSIERLPQLTAEVYKTNFAKISVVVVKKEMDTSIRLFSVEEDEMGDLMLDLTAEAREQDLALVISPKGGMVILALRPCNDNAPFEYRR